MNDAYQCVITPVTHTYTLRSVSWECALGPKHAARKEEQAQRNWMRCRNRRRLKYWRRQMEKWHKKRFPSYRFMHFGSEVES